MNKEILIEKINQFKRNEFGLLDNVEYEFNEDGSVNWRALVNPKFLYVNKEAFLRRKETPPETIENVEDKDLVISLQGLKELASLRGYTSVTYRPIVAELDHAATVCRIEWLGNYETGMVPISFEDCAGANTYNTSEMIQTYLLETATNRSFARAIRNFLRISIVSKEEMPPLKQKFNNTASNTPTNILVNLMKEKGRTFEEVKEKLIAEGDKHFPSYNGWADIPGDIAFKLVERFKNLKESKK